YRCEPFHHCLSFSFECHSHHRVLHSFPTRRSSDLLPRDAQDGRDGRRDVQEAIGRRHGGRQRRPAAAWHRERRRRAGDGTGKDGDRKSTRLNSSHEWISYAVFCLKKKKNTQTRGSV